jgi:hypothetical protein
VAIYVKDYIFVKLRPYLEITVVKCAGLNSSFKDTIDKLRGCGTVAFLCYHGYYRFESQLKLFPREIDTA